MEKLKANHGTMVCRECRSGEGALTERERMVEGVEERCLGRELVEALEGGVGVWGGVRPYGIGGGVDGEGKVEGKGKVEEKKGDDAETGCKAGGKGVLGSLSFFGYVDSRPLAVAEAYTNAGAYVGCDEEVEGEEKEEEEEEETVNCGDQYYEDEDEEEAEEDSDATLTQGETGFSNAA